MKKNTSERGSALLLVTIVALIIVGISGTYLTVSWYNSKKADQDANGVKALYIAETAAAMVINMVNHPPTDPTKPGRPIAIDTESASSTMDRTTCSSTAAAVGADTPLPSSLTSPWPR